MTTSNVMSLPVDIPWKRLGTSEDMIDEKFGDRVYPPKWRSSISIFYYEPPEEEQKFNDRIITFFKVSCTITGIEFDLEEFNLSSLYQDYIIRHLKKKQTVEMESGMLFNDWAIKIFESYKDIISYHPCYGAILQVSVFPKGEQEFSLDQYPIILDFEPKKREMYESATESKQIMSQSRSGINVKKGTTTTEYTESSWNISGFLQGSISGGGGEGSGGSTGASAGVKGGYSSKDSTSLESIDLITADYSREKRENYSYTTNLTHMYHLLNSYHLGTNRALFMVQPHPHIIDSEYTFVNGPRKLEGIQDFFLIVERPKDVPGLCVEATLETAHLETQTKWLPRIIPESDLFINDNYKKTAEALGLTDSEKGEMGKSLERIVDGWWEPIEGEFATNLEFIKARALSPGPGWPSHSIFIDEEQKKVCIRIGWNNLDSAGREKLIAAITKGESIKEPNFYLEFSVVTLPYNKGKNKFNIFALNPPPNPMIKGRWISVESFDLIGLATAVLGRNPNVKSENARVIYERTSLHTGKLFLTGRTTAACYGMPFYKAKAKVPSDFLVWENKIDIPADMISQMSKNVARAAIANKVGEMIGNQMIESLSSPDRLPYGETSVNDALFVHDALAEVLAEMPDDDEYNVHLDNIKELDPKIREKLVEVFGVQTRKEALSIDHFEIRAALELTDVETRRLRSILIGQGPRLQVKPSEILIPVPNVKGVLLEVARQMLVRAKLTANEKVVYHDALEPQETVLNQYPNAGTMVKRGSTVQLVASSGPVEIPNVVGMNIESALSRLEEYSLGAEHVLVASTEQPEGNVIETTPSANIKVPRNSKIVLMIARLPDQNVDRRSSMRAIEETQRKKSEEEQLINSCYFSMSKNGKGSAKKSEEDQERLLEEEEEQLINSCYFSMSKNRKGSAKKKRKTNKG